MKRIVSRPALARAALLSGMAATVAAAAAMAAAAPLATPAPPPATFPAPGLNTPAPAPPPRACLPGGDGYFRARLAGAIDASINWSNRGTWCQGESKGQPAGIRMSFQRVTRTKPDLLFVFGVTGVREGQPARELGANLTVFLQGTNRVYGTRGDGRCTVDTLSQRPLPHAPGAPAAYRVEARGFCTAPARAVRGEGAVLVSTFEFAGSVTYDLKEGQTI